MTLTKGSGGIFEVRRDEFVLFSKKAKGRFPEDGELTRLIEKG